ncbi:G-type lectin S-receptor-like serine/threonine-protein kinase At4g03230 [Linum perenne]
MASEITTLFFFFFIVAVLSASPVFSFQATDTITFNATSDAVLLRDSNGDTLVSAGGDFELGFFSPNGSDRRYLGIWYRNWSSTVVWVANRDNGLQDKTGELCFTAADGKLQIMNGTLKRHRQSQWSIPSSGSDNYSLRLSNSGNLILTGNELGVLWQSFDHPTDTFLSGMKMVQGLNLSSWTSPNDPTPGNYMFQLDQESSENQQQFVIKNNSEPFWNSGGQIILPISEFLMNSSSRKLNSSILRPFPGADYSDFRFLMGFDGRIQFFQRPDDTEPFWVKPHDICDLTSPCGSFGSCNSGYRWPCKCLPGFVPKFENKWYAGDFSGGCTSTNCEDDSSFLNLTVAKVQKQTSAPSKIVEEEKCKEWCMVKCSCQAYSFSDVTKSDVAGCKIWDDLRGIEEFDGRVDASVSLSIRVRISDIESTKKDCGPCGTNVIPYPLSTGLNCGDPMYSSFTCNASLGGLFFGALNTTYKVTGIDKHSRRFFIQVEKENCESKTIQLDQSLPFKIQDGGCDSDMDNVSFGPFHDGKLFYEMGIVWDSPLEPLCSSDDDCDIWPNSSCQSEVGSSSGEKRCLCEGNSRWDATNANCSQGRKDEENLVLRMYDSEKRVKEFINSEQFDEDDKRDINVPFFDLDCILAATDYFSIDNKLGQGGFGPVYKGKFPGGQEIAVKRLSSASAQGLEEFKNEVILIAKLQHKNLVRLLGYCVEGNEKILLYEYMPNKSLDFFIFDRDRCMLLDWGMRFNIIIMGIARGLLYLHHDSRLTIIHRDLKTSNILLDEEMNPRISDFGMARIMGGKETEANTVKVVGTYGYMSPEYALDGNFSIKSDVFSFGVVLLEILSGQRNTGFYKSNKVVSLLGHVWGCWKEEKAMEVMDQSLTETCVANEFMRCVNVALLCVQEDPNDRPTMANVVFMLGSEAASLSRPKEPAFSNRRQNSSTTGSSSIVSMETTTVLEAR